MLITSIPVFLNPITVIIRSTKIAIVQSSDLKINVKYLAIKLKKRLRIFSLTKFVLWINGFIAGKLNNVINRGYCNFAQCFLR